MMKIDKGGVIMHAPAFKDFEAILNPQQKTAERNSNGKLIRETLPNKWSLNMEWKLDSPEEHYIWFNYLVGLTRVNFIVEFPAPTGKIEKATFYISPISSKMLSFFGGSSGTWHPIKCTFVEV